MTMHYEEFEDTKGVIRICISKTNRQHNGQKSTKGQTTVTNKTKQKHCLLILIVLITKSKHFLLILIVFITIFYTSTYQESREISNLFMQFCFICLLWYYSLQFDIKNMKQLNWRVECKLINRWIWNGCKGFHFHFLLKGV
jgi:hypothetical protein